MRPLAPFHLADALRPIPIADDDNWADIFSKILVSAVEPMLGIGRPTVLSEYPRCEAALARAEAFAGVIPAAAARAIGKAAKTERFNAKSIGAQGLRAGTLSIPLVKALRDRVRAIDAKTPGLSGDPAWGNVTTLRTPPTRCVTNARP